MLFHLLSLENNHRDVRVLTGFDELLLNFAHELHVDVDLLIGCQLSLHGRNREHLLRRSLLHPEVETDRVLSLVLQIQGQFLGLANPHGTEV